MLKYIVIGISVCFLLVGGWYWLGSNGTPTVQQELDVRFGFIRGVQRNGGYALIFDPARWLAGKEGEDAAIAAGLCTETTRTECLPNDFFILNDATSTETLAIAAEPVIAMQTLEMEKEGIKETQISLEEFTRLIGDGSQSWTKVPYQLLVEGGQVTIIEEVYVP
ncbi:hypothetical protein HY969_04475 [Candidatus Kaiserbacteria bacterium]|nr:hypothetical protein [Candidatus Kaiserbacteria bacterium]